MFRTSFRLLSLLAIVALVHADYTIDDANTTVLKYSSNASFWAPFDAASPISFNNGPNNTYMPISLTNCYDYTYTYGACFTASQCQIQISFTGSGATVYVQQGGAEGVNASFSVDKKSESYSMLEPIPGPTFQKSNVSLFSVQGLASGSHTINLTVLDWENTWSNFFLDSIVVNETAATIASTSSSTAPTSSSSATSGTRTSLPSHAGAIAGGVIGGLVVILLAVSFFLWRRLRLTPNDTGRFDESDKSLMPQSFYTSPSSGFPVRISTVPNNNMIATQSDAQQQQIIHHPHSPASIDAPHTQESEPTDSSVFLSGGFLGEKRAAQTVLSPASVSRRLPVGALANHGGGNDSMSVVSTGGVPRLTDDQADFINTLHINNVPASAVARVMERMLAGALPSAMRGQDWMTDSGVEDLAPPLYEEHR